MPYHISAMPYEVAKYLDCKPGKTYVDCTIGGSGHARAIIEKIVPSGLLIGIDQDMDAIKHANHILKPFESNIRLFHDNFVHLPEILSHLDITAVDGILLDLGLSLHQLEKSGRGFSFKRDEPLDMRMNVKADVTAENIINTWGEENLVNIFRQYGEERRAKQVARRIVTARKHKPITTSKKLSEIVCKAIPKKDSLKRKIHPATRIFMALRIAVNDELGKLASFMESAVNLLNPGGRICVLSFHSLEDRIVKHQLKLFEKGCICPPEFPKCICNHKKIVRSLTKKTLRPSKQEIAANPMARSTKLRAAEKLA